jgi:hypothetical protein
MVCLSVCGLPHCPTNHYFRNCGLSQLDFVLFVWALMVSKALTPLPYQVVSDFRLLSEIYCFHNLDCISVHTYKPQKSQK